MLRWGIDFGQKNGIEIVTLEVSEENRRAMAFFQTFGFERTERVPALVKIGERYIDFMATVLDLRSSREDTEEKN